MSDDIDIDPNCSTCGKPRSDHHVRHPFNGPSLLETIEVLSARLAEVEAEREELAEVEEQNRTFRIIIDANIEKHRSRAERAEAKLAVAVDIAKRRGDYVPLGTVECRGDKCRQPWCISCCGEEDAEKAVSDIRNQYSEDGAALAELEAKP